MTINAYGLPKEVMSEAVAYIENNQAAQAFLRKAIIKPTNMLTKLSSKMVRMIEFKTGVKIEEVRIEEESSAKKKKRALIAFFALHPWLAINSQKPHESIIEWLMMYKEAGQLKDGEANEGKSIVIRSDGTIDIE